MRGLPCRPRGSRGVRAARLGLYIIPFVIVGATRAASHAGSPSRSKSAARASKVGASSGAKGAPAAAVRGVSSELPSADCEVGCILAGRVAVAIRVAAVAGRQLAVCGLVCAAGHAFCSVASRSAALAAADGKPVSDTCQRDANLFGARRGLGGEIEDAGRRTWRCELDELVRQARGKERIDRDPVLTDPHDCEDRCTDPSRGPPGHRQTPGRAARMSPAHRPASCSLEAGPRPAGWAQGD